MDDSQGLGPRTRAIHAGLHPAEWQGSVSPPIYQTSIFAFPSAEAAAGRFAGTDDGYIYTRLANPTVAALEEAIAELHGAPGAMACATGMAAISAVLFGLLRAGDRVVASRSIYSATRVLLEREFSRFGVTAEFVPTEDAEALRRAAPGARLVFVETPANPTLEVTDLAAAAAAARDAGALLAVDNTFLGPYLQRPLELGADLVVESATKSLGGHSDVVGGVIAARDPDLLGRLRFVVRYLGGTMDPHQAWLVHRGLRTLPLRAEAAQANAIRIADFLAEHPKVSRVFYPGRPEHPGRRLLGPQMRGPGANLAFELAGGLEAGRRFLESVRVLTFATSLGGLESLVQHPASMTHASVPPDARRAAGITDGLVRLAVGCEDPEDLLADLARALETTG